MMKREPVLPWRLLADLYGNDLSHHRAELSTAGETTYAALACNLAGTESFRNVTGKRGAHAEVRLRDSPLWKEEIPRALAQVNDLSTRPLIVTVAINRSCCGHCAEILAEALVELERRHPVRVERSFFIMAALGYYQGRGFSRSSADRDPKTLEYRPAAKRTVTTSTGLNALERAGWVQCVLSFDDEISERGSELFTYLAARCQRA